MSESTIFRDKKIHAETLVVSVKSKKPLATLLNDFPATGLCVLVAF